MEALLLINENLDNIFKMYENFGKFDYIGEPVTQIEHMIQAAMLAEEDGQSEEVILAALFHDIGHLIQLNNKNIKNNEKMSKYGFKNHEKMGLNFLKDNNIKYPIPELVENHVKAKKYLVYKDPKYRENLSDASKKTLEFQGGAMTEKEAEDFEQDKLFELSLKLRSYDDKAKVENKKIKSLDYYRRMCLEYLLSNF